MPDVARFMTVVWGLAALLVILELLVDTVPIWVTFAALAVALVLELLLGLGGWFR